MLTAKVLLLISVFATGGASESEEPVLYYYGIEESERSLPACGARQACSALVRRYWRAAALVRLCRCGRRQPCDTPAPPPRRLDLNNRAYFQFCQPTTGWPVCPFNEPALTVTSPCDRMNPDHLEEMHHEGIGLLPPNITLQCRCPNPNYWKLSSTSDNDNIRVYKCASLPVCTTGEFCGNVNYDLNALYQSCLCPKHHICVHNGGITKMQISELLYNGLGWKAYCQRVDDEYSYEDY